MEAPEGRPEGQAAGEEVLSEAAPAGSPARWVKGSERSIASTRVLELKSVRYRHPVRGTERDFVVVEAPDWVNVVAVTPDGRIVLVRQFRYGSSELSLEIPGGVVERGEDPVAAGLRELAEETGYSGQGAQLLASVYPNPAIQRNRCHFVLVEGVVVGRGTAWDVDEEIEVITAPVDEVLDWARAGRITHSLALCGLFYFEGWWRRRGGAPV